MAEVVEVVEDKERRLVVVRLKFELVKLTRHAKNKRRWMSIVGLYCRVISELCLMMCVR